MRRLARWLLPPVLLCAGYALWVGLTGRGPACPIHAALGLWCPLCGASRMGLALLRLDLPGALRANAVLLALLLPGTIWGAVHAVRYVRTGDGSVRRWERALLWGAVGVLLAGGVLRNLPAFARPLQTHPNPRFRTAQPVPEAFVRPRVRHRRNAGYSLPRCRHFFPSCPHRPAPAAE